MPRVKRGVGHVKKRRNLMKRVKGFEAGRKNLIKLAKTADTKAGAHAFRDRRRKKGEFRRVWQIRINAAVREFGLNYSKFIGGLKTKNIKLDRKVLAEIAATEPKVFKKIVELVK
ncbi:MAG: 50S ribosomal protein L20 [Candidatus Magasanikbacteria bacterium RIFCSPHIGHO2_01_FULL_33_34]|uniref:Large ribosomal subunit protein bL20 n=1 Tax=Candidatus Magasanikbacteria bacterium RIFCSPHIGHO2_01_FULL_33_34 TaxID=1798671 RepID=A0A1F6LJ76_9BACT|nr:MAG: 50S ribosomal protein L20 [Candidatus Magasanikbacteria bacterium RIFCSPHIGHO2_01_FULL_33_34]OGH65467.1 MAG: 50S ribosomal protein L20 [Candidatus Magasanikbacteria bacterium RIFCSPHIGHO2_02_FULL_33_17]OGH76177.1 MAG: 50S ribosomal protein L20 [Candidatus Magasanikbacteria bacterium RIFCSPLOWO2_01_FULL_33_34]OGH81009.1 MAG: 50S ribosomal protein L20 [Candidatus Magasanikbacteria bacterium RIFCSPLOWO2_12_FULL_34_7]